MSKSKVHVYRGGERSKFIEMLQHKSHFSKTEVEKLLMLFKQLGTTKGNIVRMDRNRFNDFLHNSFKISEEPFTDRVFKAFDTDNDSFISEMEWIMGLSICLRGTIEEQMKFCFNVYDLNSDGYIVREEMFLFLKNSFALKQPTDEDPDEGIKDMVEIILKKMDRDHDSRVSYEDWRDSILSEKLLLEAFGPCLPSDKAKNEFLELICDNANEAGMSISAQQKRKGTRQGMSHEQVAY